MSTKSLASLLSLACRSARASLARQGSCPGLRAAWAQRSSSGSAQACSAGPARAALPSSEKRYRSRAALRLISKLSTARWPATASLSLPSSLSNRARKPSSPSSLASTYAASCVLALPPRAIWRTLASDVTISSITPHSLSIQTRPQSRCHWPPSGQPA